MGGALCKECVERQEAQPVGRRAAQQMGALLLRPLGVNNKPVEGEEEEAEEAVTMMMMAMETMEGRGRQEQREEEESVEAEEEEEAEEAAEAKGEQPGETPVIPQTMGRTRTQSQT